MTKVYNDPEALTHLLEEKERDLELAARIGQTLLDENKTQSERIEELEFELLSTKEKIIQLNHDIATKSHLLELCLKNEEIEECEEDTEEATLSSLQDCSLVSISNTSHLVCELERRVGSLEDENLQLKTEKFDRVREIEDVEKKELELIAECGRNLKRTHLKLTQLQDDFQRKVDENHALSKDASFFKNKTKQLEQQLRKLIVENEELEQSLSLSNECQSELSLELIEIKEQHSKLLAAFRDKQEEYRELVAKNALHDPYFSYVQSLAYELEQPENEDAILDNYDCDGNFKNMGTYGIHDSGFAQCPTPDSLLSNDSAFNNSPYPSFVSTGDRTRSSSFVTETFVTSSSLQLSSSCGTKSIPSPKSPALCSTTLSSINSTAISSTSSLKSSLNSQTSQTPVISSVKNNLLSDKLRYIKPLEGSQILNRWKMLASPTSNALLEDGNYISRIKANLAAAEVKATIAHQKSIHAGQRIRTPLSGNSTKQTDTSDLSSFVNNFGGTSTVFTFTTTSVSQSVDSTTNVTSTFATVQPSIGKSVYKDLTFTTSSSTTDSAGSVKDFKNSAFVCALQGSSESRTIQTKISAKETALAKQNFARSLFKNSPSKSSTTTTAPQLKGAMFPKMDPIGGLNELTKILERDRVMKAVFSPRLPSSSAAMPTPKAPKLFASSMMGASLLNPNRIMTKAMVNANSELLGLTAIPTLDFSRADVSVLRNLRKGGLI